MAENTIPTAGAHILVFPYPAQGHMLPLLDFTHRLALHPNLTLTILITPKNLPLLTPLLSTHSHIQTLILPFPNHPSIPSGAENMKDLPSNSFAAMICAMGGLYNPILNWFQSHPSPPTLIFSDFFLGWTHHLAVQLGIPRVVFCTSGSITLSITSELWRDLPQKPDDPNETISFPKVPNCPSYPWWQLSPLYRYYKKGDPDSEFLRDCMLANLVSWGMIFNSFTELESVYIEHMKEVVGHQRVWAVGPLIAHGFDKPIERGGSSSVSGNEILSWLDRCNDHSVVYVCFGSQAVLTNKQMEELALGLERSEAKFIWSVKTPPNGYVASEYGTMPDGFEERVAGRGIVIKGWAPQVLILKHRAVGAFLTHCGWNSVLESLVAGVPMLIWPFGADQFMNSKLLIDEMGVAIQVCEGEKTVPSRTELAQSVVKSVSENGFLNERVRAAELSKAALGAVKDGGSSFQNMDDLVKVILSHKQ